MILTTTVRPAGPLSASRRGGLIAAAAAPSLRRAEPRVIELAVIGLGGTAGALNPLPELFPELTDRLLAVDSDVKMEVDLAAVPDRLHLGTGGSTAALLGRLERYCYLRGSAIMKAMTPHSTDNGVGKSRPVASLLLGYNLDDYKMRVRRLVERTLSRCQGPMPKRLILHTVFSLAGGTGSSLALPTALLFQAAAQSIAPSLSLRLVGHAISPSLYVGLLTTPADRERSLANAAMCLRELRLGQRPDAVADLCRALDVPCPNRPAYDEILYYDLADSGDGVRDLAEVWERIRVNVAASTHQPLQTLQLAREINPLQTRRDRGHDLAESVVSAEHSAIARAPVGKLADVYAARQLARCLHAATQPASGQQVEVLMQQYLASLGLEEAQRRGLDRLRPDHRAAFVPAAVDGLSDREVLDVCERGCKRWDGRGREELLNRANARARDARREAADRVREFLAGVGGKARTLPEYLAVLRETADVVEERRARAQRELEALASADARAAYRRARERLESSARRLFRRRDLREQVPRALARVIDGDAQSAALRLFRDEVLTPLRAVLADQLEEAERLERALHSARQRLEDFVPALEATIGHRSRYFTDVVKAEELPEMFRRLDRAVAERPGEAPAVTLGQLLRCRGEEELKQMLEEAAQGFRGRALSFFEHGVKDVKRFAEFFALEFSPEQWLADNLEITLPAKLDRTVCGPGDAPLRGYLVAGKSLEGACEEVLRAAGEAGAFEFCPSDDPFQLILKARIAHVPFDCIPGRAERDRHFKLFCETNSAALVIHDSMNRARDLPDEDGPSGG
jgi:hypothetical protein